MILHERSDCFGCPFLPKISICLLYDDYELPLRPHKYWVFKGANLKTSHPYQSEDPPTALLLPAFRARWSFAEYAVGHLPSLPPISIFDLPTSKVSNQAQRQKVSLCYNYAKSLHHARKALWSRAYIMRARDLARSLPILISESLLIA